MIDCGLDECIGFGDSGWNIFNAAGSLTSFKDVFLIFLIDAVFSLTASKCLSGWSEWSKLLLSIPWFSIEIPLFWLVILFWGSTVGSKVETFFFCNYSCWCVKGFHFTFGLIDSINLIWYILNWLEKWSVLWHWKQLTLSSTINILNVVLSRVTVIEFGSLDILSWLMFTCLHKPYICKNCTVVNPVFMIEIWEVGLIPSSWWSFIISWLGLVG